MQFEITSFTCSIRSENVKLRWFYHFLSADLFSDMDDEVLLIDLRSPDKNMQNNFEHLTENMCNIQAATR